MVYDIAIIGAGSAGISAAIYAGSRNRKILLIEKEQTFGGLIRTISTITHFTGVLENESGPAFADRMTAQLAEYDMDIAHGTVCAISHEHQPIQVITNICQYSTKKLIITAGTTQNELLHLVNHPLSANCVSHHAVQDAENYRDKAVIVIGGSDGAAKEALFLSSIAKTVTMVIVEQQLAAIPSFVKQIQQKQNIRIIADSSVIKIEGETALERLYVQNNTTNEITSIAAPNGGIFVYIGSSPNTAWCSGLTLDNGYIVTNAHMQTNIPDIYAAGDIRAKSVRQIATAVAEGAIAAIHASASLL